MPWTNISLSLPASLQDVYAGLAGTRLAAPGEMDASQSRLASVSGTATVATNPVSSTTATVEALRLAMSDILQLGGVSLCQSPYIHPLGDRRGDYAYLTPQQAIEGVLVKLADSEDMLPGGELVGVFLLIRGVDHSGFANALDSFNAVFPVTELQAVQRRAERLATLENDKLIQAIGPIYPRWAEDGGRGHEKGAALEAGIGEHLALAEGYAQEADRPEAELAALIEKKRAHLQGLETAWTALAASLQGGAGLGITLTGNSGSIRRQLAENTTQVEGYKLAAVYGWVGTAGEMTFFQELLGL